jgi:hypothetical protein
VVWAQLQQGRIQKNRGSRRCLVTVTVSFLVLPGEIKQVRTFIFQDAPEFRTVGDHVDLPLHEVLEFLNRIGASEQDSQRILELVLQVPVTVQRKRFDLNAAQEAEARRFFSGNW